MAVKDLGDEEIHKSLPFFGRNEGEYL